MSKYSLEIKLQVVKDYHSGDHGGADRLAARYGIPKKTIQNWIQWHRFYGIAGLRKKGKYNKYSGEFKLSVIRYKVDHQCSFREAAEQFNLPNASMVYRWSKRYEVEGFPGLSRRRGRQYPMSQDKSNRPKSLNESEREELIRLRAENEYLKAKELYEKKLLALLEEEEYQTRPRQE